MTKVFSLGGSLVAPDKVDTQFLKQFYALAVDYLQQNEANRLIVVVGGGGPARVYQEAARTMNQAISNETLDWIGIAATKLNAELVRAMFGELAPCPIADNPEIAPFDRGRILVASGWKPGFSSDYDAVVLAQRFKAKQVVNLSNISHAYTADPKKDANATKIEAIGWQNFIDNVVGTKWIPGANLPFDPIASGLAQQAGLTIVIAKGSNLDNIKAILNDKPYEGTTISGD